MSNKKRPKNRDPHDSNSHRTASSVSASSVGAARTADELPPDPLMASLDAALRNPQPIPLLHMASAIVAAGDPREYDLGDAPDSADDRFVVAEACEAFMSAGLQQTDGLLTVIATLTPDAMLGERIRTSVASRDHALPDWTLSLDQTYPTRVVEMTHVLGDGENLAIGVILPGNREISLMIYVDHNLGTSVKDAFATEVPLERLVEHWAELADGPESEIREVPLADARARLTEAIAAGALLHPQLETETWPMERPLLEWVLSMLPGGGTGYQRPDWSTDELDALADRFFTSPDGIPFDNSENYLLYEMIDGFGTDAGPGDPLHWSPASVEIMLADWVPSTISAGADFLLKLPALLRAFVRFAHTERGIPAQLTDETLAAIDELEPAFTRAIRLNELQATSSLLEHLGLVDEAIDVTELREELARNVGGADQLARLDTTPLPNEPFDGAGIDPQIQERVAEVNALVDGFCAAHFDAEFRTACRRFLARAAAADPAPFRRGSARTLAAAVCLVIARANDRIGSDPDLILVKDLLAWFGVSANVQRRVDPLLRAIGADPDSGGVEINDGRLLDSATRAGIIAMRDLYPSPEA